MRFVVDRAGMGMTEEMPSKYSTTKYRKCKRLAIGVQTVVYLV